MAKKLLVRQVEFDFACSHPDDKNMVVFKNGNVYKFRSGWEADDDSVLIQQKPYKGSIPIKKLFADKDNNFYLGKAGVLLMSDNTLEWDY